MRNLVYFFVAVWICFLVYLYIPAYPTLSIKEYLMKNPKDTIYFRIKDKDGLLSLVHDSSKKQSVLSGKDVWFLNVVKREYSNTTINDLNIPVEVYLGKTMFDLNYVYKLKKGDIKDNDMQYTITIRNKNVSFVK